MQQSTDKTKFAARFEALVAEEDPTGQASRAFDALKKDIAETNKAELTAIVAEAGRLKETGDVNSEAAKEIVRRIRSRAAGVMRAVSRELMRDAWTKAVAETEARSESLPFDPAVLEYLGKVAGGMKERGELE